MCHHLSQLLRVWGREDHDHCQWHISRSPEEEILQAGSCLLGCVRYRGLRGMLIGFLPKLRGEGGYCGRAPSCSIEPCTLEHPHWDAGLAWATLLSLSKGQGQTEPQESPLAHRHCCFEWKAHSLTAKF